MEEGAEPCPDCGSNKHRACDLYQRLDGPVHTWFELSYAHYLTVPRSVLQSMPVKWQKRFVECLEQLEETYDWRPEEGRYWVQLKDGSGRYVHDELMEYRHTGVFRNKNVRGQKEDLV